MNALLSQISSKLASRDGRLSPDMPATVSSPVIARKSLNLQGTHEVHEATAAPSACGEELDATTDAGAEGEEMVKREDSETYAKRTISEIETCLGFRFQGQEEGEVPTPVMDDAEIGELAVHIEAALNSGLLFKDRFCCHSSKRLTLTNTAAQPGNGPTQGLGGEGHRPGADGPAGRGSPPLGRLRDGGAAKGRAGGLPVLQLQVGSQLEQGEWQSNGRWLKQDGGGTHIPLNLQQISAEDIVKVKELGRGCFGSVWLAKWRGVEVALKELLNQGHDTNTAEVFSEAEKLASLRHPCVMGFYGIITAPECCATVAEYVCHGSLRIGLAKIKKKGIHDKRLKAYIALQAAHGMEYLHRQYIVHFDLKCDNLLADLRDLNKPVVKIGDLGLSKQKKGSFISGNMRGTLPWMAPELFPSVPGSVSGMARAGAAGGKGKDAGEDRVTEKVDVFSFGVVLWEIWSLGEQPYPSLSLQEIFAGVMTGSLRPALPPGCDPAWASLMTDCWAASPRARPGFSEVIARLGAMLQRWQAQATAPLVGAAGQGAAAGGGAHLQAGPGPHLR